jgi:hypothetical protein
VKTIAPVGLAGHVQKRETIPNRWKPAVSIDMPAFCGDPEALLSFYAFGKIGLRPGGNLGIAALFAF